MTDLRILIIANDPLARAGLSALLANQDSCAVVGQVSGDTDLPPTLDIYRPDILLWDFGWDVEATLALLTELDSVDLPVVALLPNSAYAQQVWALGIHALLQRDTDADKLVSSFAAIMQNLAVIDPDFVDSLFPQPLSDPPTLVEALTPRETEVLQLLAEGLPNKTIARRLDISEHTVKFHVNAIMNKLEAQSRTEAVVRATQLGLILL